MRNRLQHVECDTEAILLAPIRRIEQAKQQFKELYSPKYKNDILTLAVFDLCR